jgi:hypothetical protein
MPSLAVTVITPTTGKRSLDDLVQSIDMQSVHGATFHLLLWDNVREPDARPPESYNGVGRLSIVLPDGFGRNGNAPGSPLRAVGLMAAMTPWVTFADDDVRWDVDHIAALFRASDGVRWASTLRTVWSPTGEWLGIDRFESVGDDSHRRVPYEMCDNNCMIFERRLGSAAAVLYRETRDYNDDRLMYDFLKTQAGPRGTTNRPTIHQLCPSRLVDFFRANCTRE